MMRNLLEKIDKAGEQLKARIGNGYSPHSKPVPGLNQVNLIVESGSYMVQTSQFCALGREPKWHKWLSTIDQNLSTKMIETSSKPSCRESSKMMIVILNEIKIRGHVTDLIKFLQNEYPMAIYKV
jgi:hypothetical protein